MSRSSIKEGERVFAIELGSKGDVKSVSLDGNERVFIEGSLGTLKRAQFVDDLVLQVVGSKGELRVDLGSTDIQKLESEGGNDRGSER